MEVVVHGHLAFLVVGNLVVMLPDSQAWEKSEAGPMKEARVYQERSGRGH